MADTLLIHYRPSQADRLSWCLVDHSGRPGEISQDSITELADVARGLRATVLIDASCTSIEAVRIPSNNRQRQLQAAPYALEDSLASDIDELYFALGKKQPDDYIPVVTIDRQLFQATLERFRQAGIFVDTMSADVLALPIEKDSWTILLNETGALIKTAASKGHFCDRDLLPTLLPVLFNQAQQPPQSLLFMHEERDDHATDLLGSVDVALHVQTYIEHPLSIFAGNLVDVGELNLLQGKFAPKREGSRLFRPWKSVAAAAAVWLILQLIYAGFEIKQLQYQNQQLTSEIEGEFKRAIPGTRNFSNMQKRMERRLQELRGGGSGDDEEAFLELLSSAALSFSNQPVTIHGLVYNNKHIDMELQASSLQQLESVKNKLSSIKNIKTTLSTSLEKDKVKGRLRLEKQG
jgi:general secretion pathway protein L